MKEFSATPPHQEKEFHSVRMDPLHNTETVEFVTHFKHIQEDLEHLFTLTVTSEMSLTYPWVKDEMYSKVVEELQLGTPFALDYMFEEKLLTKEELKTRGIQELKSYAKTILTIYKGTRLTRAKTLFLESGLLTEEEIKNSLS